MSRHMTQGRRTDQGLHFKVRHHLMGFLLIKQFIIQREVVTGVLSQSGPGGGSRHERVARADE